MSKSFGKYLKALRMDRELSLREVERLTGISNSYLSQIERGERGKPTLTLIQKLANAYQVNISKLLISEIKNNVQEDKAQIQSSLPNYAICAGKLLDELNVEQRYFLLNMLLETYKREYFASHNTSDYYKILEKYFSEELKEDCIKSMVYSSNFKKSTEKKIKKSFSY